MTIVSKDSVAKKKVFEIINKELSKAIMTRTKLSNNFLRNNSEENRKLYAKQINFVSFF